MSEPHLKDQNPPNLLYLKFHKFRVILRESSGDRDEIPVSTRSEKYPSTPSSFDH
jgi:hypothetical protein